MKHYIQFLSHQLKGWPQQNYYLFFFSLGCQVMTLVGQKITLLAVLTFIGTTLGGSMCTGHQRRQISQRLAGCAFRYLFHRLRPRIT